MTIFSALPSRRNVLAGVPVLGLTACASEGKSSVRQTSAKIQPTPLERANEKVVNDFCEDWKYGDAERLTSYFTDDIIYQVVEGVPLINGKAEFIEKVQPFLDNFKDIRWEILRSSPMGRLVLNDRIDYYEDPIKGDSQIFKVTGIFQVEDGLIKDWRDWSIPEAG